jgi:EmrB/QacA subfamily drug resistance transporter
MTTTTLDRSPEAPTAADPRRWWVLAVMSLSIFMIFVDNTVVNTAIPSIARDLQASTSTLQWVVDGYTLVLAGLLLAGGTIGDRYGRRRWMTIGMVVFGLASVGAAFSSSAGTLIAFRALQGAGAALVMPATLSILTDVFPRRERAMAIGIWTGVGGLGIGFGPALGGYLVDQLNWAAVFWLHIPVVAVALIGLTLVVPESRDSRARRLDIPGAVLATGGLLAVVYAIIQGSESGWTSPSIVGAFGLGALALVAFAAVELRSDHPMLPLRFFRERDFAGAVLIIGIVFFALFVTFFFLTQLFQLVQGRSAFEAGLLIVPVALAMMVAAPISGVLVQRVGPRVLLLGSLSAMIVAMLALTQLDADTSTLQVAGTLFFFGVGGGLGMTPLTDTVMAAVPVDDAGIGSAVNDFSRELGGALGIALIGSIVNGFYRSNVQDALAGQAPAEVIEAARESVGVATTTASQLSPELAATVTAAVNQSFIDAIGAGLLVSIAFLVGGLAVAALMLPNTTRATQAQGAPTIQPAIGEALPSMAPTGAVASGSVAAETEAA